MTQSSSHPQESEQVSLCSCRSAKDSPVGRDSLAFRILGLTLCCILVGTLALVLISCVLQNQAYPPDSDSAIHLVQGLTPMLDAKAGRWVKLARHLYFQRWYPPLYPVMLMLVFAGCGPNLVAARLMSVGLWVFSLPLLVLVLRSLSERCQTTGEMVVAFMGAIAPLPVLLATLCMEEGPATVLLLSFILVYIRTLERTSQRRRKATVWSGLILGAVFLSRISTGLFLASALLVNEILEGWHRKSDWHSGKRIAMLMGPLAIVAALWLAHPEKAAGFLGYLEVSVPRFALFSKENLTYYGLVLAETYVAAWPLAPWMFASVLISLREWQRGAVRFLLLLVIVTLGSLMLKRQANPRFAIPAALAAFILTGYQAGRLAWSLRTSGRWHRVVAGGLLALTLVLSVHPLYRRFSTLPFALQVNYETDSEINDLYAWVAEHVPPDERRIMLVNGWDQCSGFALQWYLSSSEQTPPKTSDEVFVEQFDLKIPSDEVIGSFVQSLEQHRIQYILHLEGGPVSQAGAWWAYKSTIENRSVEVGQQTFTIRLWDGQVMDRLLRNQVSPGQVKAIQTTQHYPISVQATLFAVDAKSAH